MTSKYHNQGIINLVLRRLCIADPKRSDIAKATTQRNKLLNKVTQEELQTANKVLSLLVEASKVELTISEQGEEQDYYATKLDGLLTAKGIVNELAGGIRKCID